MAEKPFSKYTRDKTWAGVHSQYINACYALVPHSATNNSMYIMRCNSPEETARKAKELLDIEEECQRVFGPSTSTKKLPSFLANAAQMVVLAKSSDYYRYSLSDAVEIRLVACGLHDSYLPVTTWEIRTNKRYSARTTSLAIGSAEFDHLRCTQYGHNVLMGALVAGDVDAIAYLATLPPRTQRRLRHEKEILQHTRYQGRPLAFMTEDERRAHGAKISEGLKRYHAMKG